MNDLLKNFKLDEVSETDNGTSLLIYLTNNNIVDGTKAFETLTNQSVNNAFANTGEDKNHLAAFTIAIEINHESGEPIATISPTIKTDDGTSDIDHSDMTISTADIVDLLANTAANEIPEELMNKLKEQALIERILEIGNDAISDFVDFDTTNMSLEEIKDEIDDVLAQMPDDIFDLYYERYITNRKDS